MNVRKAVRFVSYFTCILAVLGSYTFVSAVISQVVSALDAPLLWMGVGAATVITCMMTSVIAFNLSQEDDNG